MLTVWGVLHQSLVLGSHGIALEVVFQMAGNRHIVGVEGLLIHILPCGHIYHFQIRFRPGLCNLQAVSHRLVHIPQIGMREVPVVIAIVMVVIGVGAVAQSLQLGAHGEGHIVL